MNTKLFFITTALIMLFILPAQLKANEVSQAQKTVKSFEQVFGITHGKRRNHTKGFCFTGRLLPAQSSISTLTTSQLFSAESSVIGRLSHKGGNSAPSDIHPGEYGMGIVISLSNGEKHIMSMNTLDFFPVATASDFAKLMHAKAKGPEAVKAFKQENSAFQRFKRHMASKTKKLAPYEAQQFNSINSFYLESSAREKAPFRWSFVPTQQHSLVTEPSTHFFYDNLSRNIKDKGVAWDMIVTIANKEDDVNNPAIQWKGKHQEINAAKLIVDAITKEQDGQCEGVNFDPLVLSNGILPSEDSLLQARRNAYAVSFGKRVSEK